MTHFVPLLSENRRASAFLATLLLGVAVSFLWIGEAEAAPYATKSEASKVSKEGVHLSDGSGSESVVGGSDSRRADFFVSADVGLIGNVALSETMDVGIAYSAGGRSGNLALGVEALFALVEPSPTLAREQPAEGSDSLGFAGFSSVAKLFFPLGSFEPYGQTGFGFHCLEGGSDECPLVVDLGAGLDFKVTENVSLGGKYVQSGYWFDQSASNQLYFAWSARTSVSLYF